MKYHLRFLFLLSVAISSSTLPGQEVISIGERSKAVDALEASKDLLLNTVKGLTPAQLNYKSAAEAWSVAECVEHLAISEKNIFGLVSMALEGPADPSQRASLPFSDEQVMQFITDRSTKVKTQEAFEPKGNFGSYKGSLDEFKAQRKSNIKYMKKTEDDLRNHYFDFPFGKVDAYQIVLFMSGHTVRHTDQIKEVMADSEFPDK